MKVRMVFGRSSITVVRSLTEYPDDVYDYAADVTLSEGAQLHVDVAPAGSFSSAANDMPTAARLTVIPTRPVRSSGRTAPGAAAAPATLRARHRRRAACTIESTWR